MGVSPAGKCHWLRHPYVCHVFQQEIHTLSPTVKSELRDMKNDGSASSVAGGMSTGARSLG